MRRNKYVFYIVFSVTIFFLFFITIFIRNSPRITDYSLYLKPTLINARHSGAAPLRENLSGDDLTGDDQAFHNLKAKISDFDDSCPSSVERGEWIQYYTWFSKQMGMTPDDDFREVRKKYNQSFLAKQNITTTPGDHTGYTYTVTHQVIATDDVIDIVKLTIKELVGGQHTEGGSSFRINVQSKMHRQVCPTKDYFNGVYFSCCTVDKSFIGASYTIAISVQFVNFNAFSAVASSTDHPIWTQQFTNNGPSAQSTSPQYQDCQRVEYMDTEAGYWIKESTSHLEYNRYILEDRDSPGGHCVFHVMDPKDVAECFQERFSNAMTLIGDSHIRYAFYHLINLSTGSNRIGDGHDDVKIDSHYFKWKPFCEELVSGLQEYLNDHKTSNLSYSISHPRYHLLILGTGHWDLRGKTAESYLSCVGFQVYPLVKQIQQLHHTVIIWQSLPPVPDLKPVEKGETKRNNFLVAAMNYFTKTLMEPVITASIPTRSIALPWSENLGAGTSHLYNLVYGRGPSKLIVLPPGDVVTSLLAYQACKDK